MPRDPQRTLDTLLGELEQLLRGSRNVLVEPEALRAVVARYSPQHAVTAPTPNTPPIAPTPEHVPKAPLTTARTLQFS